MRPSQHSVSFKLAFGCVGKLDARSEVSDSHMVNFLYNELLSKKKEKLALHHDAADLEKVDV